MMQLWRREQSTVSNSIFHARLPLENLQFKGELLIGKNIGMSNNKLLFPMNYYLPVEHSANMLPTKRIFLHYNINI